MPYKAREVLAKLQRAGVVVKRQSGSHAVLRHADGRQPYIAMHPGDVPTRTFRAILKQTNLAEDAFRSLGAISPRWTTRRPSLHSPPFPIGERALRLRRECRGGSQVKRD